MQKPGFPVLASALVLLLAGCGGSATTSSTSSTTTAAVTPLVTGNYQLAGASSVYAGASFGVPASIVSGSGSVSVVAHFTGSSCFPYATPIAFAGTQDSKGNLLLTSAAVSGQVVTVTALVGSNGQQVSGTYAVAGGCAAGDKGTLGGFNIPDISGTYKGTITSKSGTQIATTAQVSQTAADGSGYFHFTSTLTFTGSPCFTSATTNTTSVSVLNGNTFTGFYSSGSSTATSSLLTVNGLVNSSLGAAPTSLTLSSYTVSGGMCSGDSGSGQLTKQ